jgi:hypothetical protein
MAGVAVSDALEAFGRPVADPPRHPVLHGTAGTLITFGLPEADGRLRYTGVWVGPAGARFLDPIAPATGAPAAHGLSGPSAHLFDLFLDAARTYLERVEEVDERLAEVQQKGRTVPLSEVWSLERRNAVIRAQIGRALVGLAECGGRLAATFPAFPAALPAVAAELTRVQQLAGGVQQALSDLILLRNAEEANRIAEAANELSRISNRIASLANTSNIRMLGITYVALVLGLVSAAVLIPNTGGTILGMPSAAWVPGYWVDIILIALAIVPVVVIFTRPWVRVLLASLQDSEVRVGEGLRDLPELQAESPEERRGRR